MNDSPVGIAAWITEKFNSWSHTDGDDIESAHTKDELLTNIMIYIVTGHVQFGELDLLRPPRRGRAPLVAGRQTRRSADGLCALSRRAPGLAAAQLCRADL